MRLREARARSRAQLPAPAPAIAAASSRERAITALQSGAGNAATTSALQAVGAVRTPGRPLEIGVRDEMERRLGADLRSVRVHTDGHASATAATIGAHAYTVGDHVVFRSDVYKPDSKAGRRMLAHELAHVIQQREGVVEGPGIVARDHESEEHADRVAARIWSGPPSGTRSRATR